MDAAADDKTMGRRERKKLGTRSQVLNVAKDMFEEFGYSNTTLEALAEQVNVTVRTILRYFDTKADLALAPILDTFDAFAVRIQDPYRTRPAVDVWRDHVAKQSEGHLGGLGRQQAWIGREPELVARLDELAVRYEEVLAEGIASDTQADPNDFAPAVLAACLVHSTEALARHWPRKGGGTNLARYQEKVIDRLIDRLTDLPEG